MRRFLSLCLALLVAAGAAGAETLQCDASEPLHAISGTLYGLFFEDINHAADGGLYAELLQNRSFENEDMTRPSVAQHLAGWQFNTLPGGKGSAGLETESPLCDTNPHYMHITAQEAGYAFQNLGYTSSVLRGGICIEEGASYDVSLYLRCPAGGMEVEAALTGRTGEKLSDTVRFVPGTQWGKQEGVLTASAGSEEACLTLILTGEGELDADMASLMPCDRFGADWPGGGVRRDLFEALEALQPRFLRFPGGCVTEGSHVWDNLYRWKDTVGPVERRKENWNTWGYMQSYGLGFYEYFCLCEALGALPLPVVGSGVLCQAREMRDPPMNGEELAAWTQDVLDLVEFARGSAETEWGKLRAEMGHPEPFDLRMLGIGNENWGDVYFSRYTVIRDAVRAAYPDITCIAACGPVMEGSLFHAGRSRILRAFPEDIADEHGYNDCEWFLRNTHRYDAYPRTGSVFVGEYAAHEPAAGGRRPNTLYSALCEAAFLTGIERNSDAVAMCCYAPLMARLGLDQWTPDLIWFSGSGVVCTPNYYIQQMFSSSLGTQVIRSTLTDESGAPAEKDLLFHTASVDADGRVALKMVNVSGKEKSVRIRILGKGDGEGTVTVLSGEKQAVNTPGRENVSPETAGFSLRGGEAELLMPGYSAAVVTVP